MDQFPIETLIGDAWVSHLPSHLSAVTAEALEAASIPPSAKRLLLSTGNGSQWDHPSRTPARDFVALTPDAADWIVDRGILLLGIDYLSVDPADSQDLPAHRILLSHDVVVVEGLDLRRVPEGAYRLYCLPLRLRGADGSPARVVLTSDQ